MLSKNLEEIEAAHWHLNVGIEYSQACFLLTAYFDAAQERWTKGVERPMYYCGGLAIEHFLKCYLDLKNKGYSKSGNQGHNLSDLISLDEDLKKFFDLDEYDAELIKILDKRYSASVEYGKQDLRYSNKTGLRISPHPDPLNRVLKNMERKLNALF